MDKHQDSLGTFEQIVMTAVLALGNDAYGLAVHRKVEELGGRPVKSPEAAQKLALPVQTRTAVKFQVRPNPTAR